MAYEGTNQTGTAVEEGDPLTVSIDTIPDPVIVVDHAQNQIVTTNEAAGDLFECSPDTLIGMSFEDIHPIDTQADAANYTEVLERGRNNKRVNRLQTGEPIYIETLDGAVKPVEINTQRLSTVDGEHILGIFRDATEQHTREQDLRSTTNRLETLLEALPLPVAVTSPDGIVTQWNQAAEELYGYSADEVVGEPHPVFPDELELEDLLERVTNGEMLDGYETVHRTKDGSHIHLELYLRPLYDDGEISGTIGAAVDITDQRRRVQQLEVLHRTLRHNIRNQLNVVQGHLELLADQLDTGNGSIETAVSATEEVLTRAEIAQQIGVVSQQDGVTQSSIPELVAAAVEHYRDMKGMSLETDVEDVSVRTVGGFETAIEHAFDNAVEHTTAPVSVAVTTETTEEEVSLIIADDGEGIPESELEAVTAEKETPLEHGSGIGLWAMKWLTEESGGRFGVRADASGTVVRMRLPRAN